MDFNHILLWVSSISALVTVLKTRPTDRPTWFFYGILIILISIAGVFHFPDTAGYIAGAIWTLTLFIPGLAFRKVQALAATQNYGRARKLTALIRLIHPGSFTTNFQTLLTALEAMHSGRSAEARAILEQQSSSPSALALSARAYLYLMESDWPAVLAWVDREEQSEISAGRDSSHPNAFLNRNLFLLPVYLRALFETGKLNEALTIYSEKRLQLSKGDQSVLSLCWLMIFAFCGRRKTLEELFDRNLSDHSDQLKRFWLATASFTRGEVQTSLAVFEELSFSENLSISSGARRRIEHGLPDPDIALTPLSQVHLTEAERDLYAANLVNQPGGRMQSNSLTRALIALNIITFVLEVMKGGSENPHVLFEMGALVPAIVLEYQQWWRVVTSMFLHFGASHLLMNMLGLWILGPFLEASLGKVRFVICYLACGILSMASIVGLWHYRIVDYGVVVGASGAIMGLIGASAWVIFTIWLRERSVASTRKLKDVLVIVALQAFFDMITPQVSFAAHATGFVIGIFVAALLYRKPRERLLQ